MDTITETVTDVDKLKLLLLDDEADILKSLTRVLRRDYDVVSFTSGVEALEYLASNDVPILLSDMRMPEMDGAEFLAKAKEINPQSMRVLLTGYSDMDSTIRAVNEGGIHTYLSKPWDNAGLKLTIEKVAELYTLRQEKAKLMIELEGKNLQLAQWNQQLEEKVTQRTKLLQETNYNLKTVLKSRQQTFKDILSMLTAIIQHATGQPRDHAERIAEQAKMLAKVLGLSDSEINHVYLAALMHEIGLIGGLNHDLAKKYESGGVQFPNVNAQLGSEVIGQIKRFSPLVDIVLHQDENYDGSGFPQHLKAEQIPVGARILRVVKNYDYLVASPINARRMTTRSAYAFLDKNKNRLYDPAIVKFYLSMIKNLTQTDGVQLCVGVDDLKVGTTIKKDVYLPNGSLMLTAGQEINSALLQRLKELDRTSEQPLAFHI
ncbi:MULTISPECIES: HD domain-containing phosphohydrolase [unclassified Vibrio]|uniref:HD domain-containing phosphohydrolase n=1 Tax=Vibrio sp. HB236076 TaxID=3232307 RepID=A0AB39HJ38_9VIBR|nr:HD domain-containing phosphohydrolase [Vibrio sp. HB161653]MDP5252696.1 response regulator [Vibrio sp. HB161653]